MRWSRERRSQAQRPQRSVRPGSPPLVTDGPFAETKEAVGGFYLIDCESREQALDLAGQVPPSPGAAVEVLPVVEF